MGMGEMMHVEHAIHHLSLAACILDEIERLLGQRQAEPLMLGDFGGDLGHFLAQRLARENLVHHAEIIGALGRHAAA